jgi:hypothetical protein
VSLSVSIAELIAAEGGEVTFARFMELALTHPTLGYYSRADRLLGRRGDFNTAPALSPFFNRTLARLVTELLDAALLAGGPDAGRHPWDVGRAIPGAPRESRLPRGRDRGEAAAAAG